MTAADDRERGGSLSVASKAVSRGRPAWARKVRRASGWLASLAIVEAVLVGVLFDFDAPLRRMLNALTLDQFLVAIVLFLVIAPLVGWGGPRRQGMVTVADGTLTIERDAKRFVVPLERIRQGLYRPDAASQIQWDLEDGSQIRVAVNSPAEADQLLKATCSDPSRRSVRFDRAMMVGQTIRFILFAIVGWCPAVLGGSFVERWIPGFWHAVPLLWIATVASAMKLVAPPRIVIGADGLSVQHPLRRARFYRFADLESCMVHAATLHIVPRDAPSVTVGIEMLPTEDVAALDARVRAARADAARRVRVDLGAEGTLDRRGRSFDAWRDDLARLLDAPSGYRAAVLTVADLDLIVADPNAPAERRIAAAVALASSSPADGSTRIRVVADACANEPLRHAFERAAAGELDEADVDRALANDVAR